MADIEALMKVIAELPKAAHCRAATRPAICTLLLLTVESVRAMSDEFVTTGQTVLVQELTCEIAGRVPVSSMMLSPSSIASAARRAIARLPMAFSRIRRSKGASADCLRQSGGTMHLQDLAALRHQAQVAADGLGRDTQANRRDRSPRPTCGHAASDGFRHAGVKDRFMDIFARYPAD